MTSILRLLITFSMLSQPGEPAQANAGGAAPASESTAQSPVASAESEIVAPRRGAGAGASKSIGVGALADGLWPLGVVLALILGGAVVLRRVFPKRGGQGEGELIKVISRQYLSPKQSICLVRVGSRILALGVTAEQISTLAQIDDAIGVSKLVGAAESGRANSMSGRFQSFMTGASSEFEEASGREALTAVARLRESVRGAGRSIARG